MCTGGSTSPRLLIPFLYQKSRSQADDAEDRDARSGRRRNEADAETGDQQTGREDELTLFTDGRAIVKGRAGERNRQVSAVPWLAEVRR